MEIEEKKTARTIPPTFSLTIYSEQGNLFTGEAFAIATQNESGPLSILSGHANFISLIVDSLTVFQDHEQPQGTAIPMDRGVLRVFNNHVQVFVGIGSFVEFKGTTFSAPEVVASETVAERQAQTDQSVG